MASVEIRVVRKSFGPVDVLHGVSIDIGDEEFVALVGPSGCGKTTLLRMIAGLEQITGGEIAIGGRVVNQLPPKERDIAMVFQNYALYPHMTVRDNMAFSLKLRRAEQAVIDARVNQAAEILGLGQLLDRYPRQLSGGQRQRVAIGRAIVREPKAFLFDEPLSNLDAALRVQMRVEIGELHHDLKTTMVYVTHDQVEAMTMANKIVVLDRGSVAQVGSPLELYNRPNGLFVAGFIGSPKMNFIRGVSADKRGAAVIGIRPEHADISTTAGEWPATVRLAEHLGSDTFIHAEGDGIGPLTLRLEGEAPLQPDQRIFVTPREANLHKFDKDGRRID